MSATSIFARAAGEGTQALVYEMSFSASADVAMVLPLPLSPGADERALTFVSLERYPGFFRDLERGYADEVDGSLAPLRHAPRAPIAVQQVGAFEASFAPSVSDLDRLDPRFRLPRSALSALSLGEGWGFAVFKLRGEAPPPKGLVDRLLGALLGRPSAEPAPRRVHPMAFTFSPRDPSKLFFPTVHVHDQHVHKTAHFDHALYAQVPPSAPVDWRRSSGPAGAHVDGARALGLVDDALPLVRLEMRGELPNRDVYLPIA